MSRVRRVEPVPVDGADYVSTFALDGAGREAQDWALAVFGDAPPVFRLILRLGWRVILRLRLDGAPDTLGWTLTSGSPDEATLSADGPLLVASNIVGVTADGMTWTTSVRYRTVRGRILWSAAAPVHHVTLPWLLRRAARR